MMIKFVCASTTRCFTALSVLGLSRSGGLVCALGASVGRLLLGSVTLGSRSAFSGTSAFCIRIYFGNCRDVDCYQLVSKFESNHPTYNFGCGN